MKPLCLTREQTREIDRRAIEVLGIPGMVLMENAGRGCVDVMERVGIDGPVVILCGKGNNAGDGFVIARHLAIRGYDICVQMLATTDSLTGDARTNFEVLRKLQIPFDELAPLADNYEALVSALDDRGANANWLVDALLGTGAQGEPRAPFDTAIDWMNGQAAIRLAVDIPSGLNCDTGQPAKHTLRADHTATFVALKTGFQTTAAQHYLGKVHVLDIGIPASW